MLKARHLNRVAMALILPFMAIAIVVGARAARGGDAPDPPASGRLIVANLRAETLTFFDFANLDDTRVLVAGGPPHELVVSNGRIYASLGRAGRLVEVTPQGPAILRSIPLDGHPHGLAVHADQLAVGLDDRNQVVWLDLASMAEQGRADTGAVPHMLAGSAESESLYATNARDGRVERLGGPTAPAGRQPESLAVVGRVVAVADAESGVLFVFDLELNLLAEVQVGGQPVRVVPIAGHEVAVALNAAAEVALVDLETARVTRRVQVLERPDGICLSDDGAFAAVVSNAADAVQIFDTRRWELAATLFTGDGPGACAWL
jgi:DNA-binding beta-propeller fold protein YncE